LKRYRYLLGQTELFAHFFNLKVEQDEELRKVMEEKEDESKRQDEDGYGILGRSVTKVNNV
jgi:hypothetical protein